MSMDKPSSAVLLRGGTQRPTPEAPRRSSLQSNVEQFKLLQAMGARPVAQKHVSLTTRASALSHDSLAHARRLLVPLPTPSGTPFAHPPLVRPASTSAAASLLHHHTNNFPSTSLLLDRNSTICNAVIVLWNNKRKLQALRQWRDVTTAENVRLRDDFVQRVRTATKDLLLAKAKAMHDECAMVFTPAQVDTLVTWALQIQTKSFVGVKPSMVEDLVQHMALRTYADKTCLFMEGDVGQFYYILFTGAVGIYVGISPETKAIAQTNHGHAMRCIRSDPSFLGAAYGNEAIPRRARVIEWTFSRQEQAITTHLVHRSSTTEDMITGEPYLIYKKTIERPSIGSLRGGGGAF
ncbi:hypothetical protein DYB35_001958 [Aphanomyces astaci]|uniref:Cyclic nucleotide-binding domain-containing protein n=2 Tax=Aphanomyces astaci TaxID=112090 RepID=A0A418DDU1_APHAT|nr:hypothetical protein DYB35_001958 [Aphanomyces astaci]